ncbi:MAG: SH3 domain-containing protein [Syntrophomonadaceae bacterium]|nr:SH3 domain-containing protein [Syntrophomonadaceae bacterium]
MQLRRIAFLTIIMVVMLATGYLAGRSVEAGPGGSLVPGSAADPLVSESYLRQAVGEATATLQAQIAGLQARVEELTRTIAILEGQAPPVTPSPAPVPAPQLKPPPVQALRKAVVTVSSANVRGGPGTSFARVASLSRGAVVTILEEKTGWYQIEYSAGKRGWILGSLVQIQN